MSAPAKGLAASSAAERAAALEEAEANAKRGLDARLRDLDAQKGAARDAHEAAVASARAEVERTCHALDEALAGELRATVYATAERFADAPRTVAVELASAWRAVATKTKEQTGREIDPRHLALAMLAPHGEDALLVAASDPDFWRHASGNRAADALGAAIRAIESNAAAPVLEHALRELERHACERVASPRAVARRPDRLRAMQSRACRPGVEAAVREVEESEEADRRARAAKESSEAFARFHAEQLGKLARAARRSRWFDDWRTTI